MRGFDSRSLALTASLAGLYAAFRIVPLSKFIGLPGTLTAGGMSIPILAVLLSPEYGAIAIFFGTLIGFLSPSNPVRFAGLDFVPATLNFLVVSMLIRGKRIYAAGLNLGVVLTFVLVPHTTIFVGGDLFSPPLPYFWLHLAGLVLLISPLSRNIVAKLESESYSSVATVVAMIAFIGTMAEHITGGTLFAIFFPSVADASWRFIYPLYPIERAIIVVGAVLICTPVLRNVRVVGENRIFERARAVIKRGRGI